MSATSPDDATGAFPRAAILIATLLQGFLVYGLFEATTSDHWLTASDSRAYPLWTLVLILPPVFALTVRRGSRWRLAIGLGAYTTILAVVATYTGHQAGPDEAVRSVSIAGYFAAAMAVATFKTVIYLSPWAAGTPITYAALFSQSWRCFLVACLTTLFVLVFWLVLGLWALLFATIGIETFTRLFGEPAFGFPATGLALGIGVILFRGLTGVIDNVAALLQGLIKTLLPLLLLATVLFLGALPFTGLAPLWDTGRGTAVLLGLLAVVLFFANAVYQDGRGAAPYPPALHRFIYLGIALLAVVSGLSLYGLLLRIGQYGWSVERCWAVFVWGLLTLFLTGYVWGIVRRRDAWTVTLGQVNTVMGLLVLGAVLLASSPLLDFRRISVASQLARASSPASTPADFDFRYAARHLGRPGHRALLDLQRDAEVDDPDLAARIAGILADATPRQTDPVDVQEVMAKAAYRPETFEVPDDLQALLEELVRTTSAHGLVLLNEPLLGEGPEYSAVLLRGDAVVHARHYYRSAGVWQWVDLNATPVSASANDALQGMVRTTPPRFRDLKLGALRLSPGPVLPDG